MKFFPLICVLLLLSCRGEKSEGLHLALWSEFLSPAQVKEQIPFLKRNNLALYQAVHHDMLWNSEIKELLISAHNAGIETRAWLLLDYPDGYWPNEENVDKFTAQTVSFMDWVQSENIPVRWIVVDMELSWQKTQDLSGANGDFSKILNLLESNIDIEKFNIAKQKYVELVTSAHERGFKVMCVTYPQVLDDIADGDDSIQDALDIPVTQIDWDEVSFMVYRTTFNEMWAQGFTSYLVYSYAKSAIELFGEKAGIDVGLVAPYQSQGGGNVPGLANGYTSPEGLLEDISAAWSAGIKSVHIWPLDYVVSYPEPDKWVNTSGLSTTPPAPDSVTDSMRELFSILDNAIK
jgi:hypothetical protein